MLKQARAAVGDLPGGVERALNAAINRLLELDRNALVRLARLEGRTIALGLRDSEQRLVAVVRAGALCVDRAHAGAVDVSIRGRPADFVALVRAKRRGDVLGAGRIEINGDLAVAQEVQALLGELDLDWDELIARYLGDVAAHRLGRLLRGLAAFGRDGARRLEQDTADYLRHELDVLPARAEVELFGREVAALADAVERAAARLRLRSARRRQP